MRPSFFRSISERLCARLIFGAPAVAAFLLSFFTGLPGDVRRARADSVQAVVVAPSTAVSAGESMAVVVIFKNKGSKTASLSFEKGGRFQWIRDGRRTALTGLWLGPASGAGGSVAPGSYEEHRFAISIPTQPPGFARLKLLDPASNTVILEIAETAGNVAAEENPSAPPPEDGQTRLSALESKIQPYFANLFFYEPMYFLVGADPKKSKFQLSFKYRLFREKSSLAEEFSILKGIHFAYTQTSYWDLKSDSAPFEDTSYKPELFYVSPGFDLKLPMLYTANLQVGARHESNGRAGIDSRSTNTIYAQPIFIFARSDPDAGILVAPRIMAYVGNDEKTNPDLPDYRGFFDLEIKTGFLKSFVLDTHLRYGKKGGSAQFDLTHPLTDLLGGNIDLYLYIQYYAGYAESLLHYDRREDALRFGFSIAR